MDEYHWIRQHFGAEKHCIISLLNLIPSKNKKRYNEASPPNNLDNTGEWLGKDTIDPHLLVCQIIFENAGRQLRKDAIDPIVSMPNSLENTGHRQRKDAIDPHLLVYTTHPLPSQQASGQWFPGWPVTIGWQVTL